MSENKKPIIYADTIKVRFNDLDPYGHVNSAIYLDYIISSRWSFLEKELKVTSDELIKKGLGFYLVNSNLNYKKSIKGAAEIQVKSWTSNLTNTMLTVDYTIEHNEQVVSDGKLQFVIMDLKSMKPQKYPDWATYLFWE